MKNFTMFNNLATRDAGREHTSAARYTASFTPDIDSETDRKRLDNGSMKSHIWKYAAMLLMVLVLGVGEMWGAITFSGGYVYFDNTNTNWSTTYVMLFAHQYAGKDYTGVTTMSKISGTNNLYYVANPTGSNWGDIWGWRFVGNSTSWNSGEFGDAATKSGVEKYTNYSTDGLSNGYSYLCYGASSTNGCNITRTSLGNSATQYTSLNYTQTLNQTLSTDGGSTYSASTLALATVTVSANKLNGRNSTTSNSGTITSGSSSTTCSAARTATVTYSVSSIAAGYSFVGWYDGSTQKSTSTTYTYNATAAKTITARFKAEETHDVTVYYKYGSVTVKTATTESAVGVSTARGFTAPTIDGYNFFSYTFGSGLTMKSAETNTNPCSFVTNASGTYELTVNYNIAPVKLLYGSTTPLNSPSNTAMTYDAYNKVHYVDVTTNSSPYYFRFDYNTNTQEYGGAWDTYPNVVEATANGAKVACEEEVKGWDNKSSVKFTGANGSAIRIYFDYFNKKTWITEATYTVTFNNGDHGTVSPSGDQEVGASSGKSITATPQAGYRFSSWSKTGSVTLSSTSTNPTTVRATGTGTVTPSYVRSYAFIEGRLSVYNAARTTETHVASSKGGWDKSSTRIAMEYDGTNHRFYRHTYKTPAELSTQQSGQDQWFAFKTSTSSSSLATPQPFEPATSQSMTTTGSANKKALSAADNDRHIKFNSSATDGYAVIYFDEAGVWYELEHTLKYNANGGTGSAPATAYYLKGTTATAAAANTFTRAGYNFNGWKTAPSSGTSYAAGASVTMNSNITLYAQWAAKTYTITLDKQTTAPGYGGSGTASVPTVTYNATLPAISGTMPTGTGSYGFLGFYTEVNGGGKRLTDADGTWIASVAGYTDADKKWIYDGNVTLYAYYTTPEITKLTFVNAIVSPSATVQVTPTIEPTPAATTHIDWRVLYSNGSALASQPAMSVYNTTGVQFEAPTTSATYMVEAVLRTGSTPGSGTTIHTKTETFQVAGSHTITVRYQDGDGRALATSGSITARPLEWTTAGDITPPAIVGYTFTRWDAGDGVTIKNGDSDPVTTTTTSSIQIKAIYDGTLTAVYTKKNLIYFNNTLGWDTVYVYFYENGNYWNDTYGTGANQDQNWGGQNPYWFGEHGGMKRVAPGSNIWYFDYLAAGYSTFRGNVVFANKDQSKQTDCAGDNECIFFSDNAKVVRRGDHTTDLPMFVPLAGQTAVKRNNNKASYYNEGYWMNYPENTGYTLKIYNAWNATKETEAVRSIPFPYSQDKKMPLKLDVEFNDAGTHEYWFMVYRNDGTYLGNTYVFNQNYNNEQVITGGNNKSKLVTSAPGIYTLTLTYHDGNYYIDPDFPVAVNDYRIVYSDLAAWSKGTHTAAWAHASDVIRKIDGEATEAKKDIVSFYIAKDNSPSMKFQKVTSITDAGVVTWTDVPSGTIDLSSFSSAITEAGVYNLHLTQPVGGSSISVEKVEKYTGNYYIRTDCAGSTKWDSYKATDHQMTYSDYAKDYSYDDASKRYTHYYAHWVTQGMNIKYTVANDYSLCISDTLIGDYETTIAGTDEYGNLTSDDANIRFMYNEATNKLSRAYISGSGTITDRFLVLEGDAKMYDENGNALTGANQDHKGGTYLGKDNQVILYDDENFVYERSIQVNTGARAKLTAKYNNNVQYFKGSAGDFADGTTVQLLGGSATGKHSMRIVYDFKTNRLVTAYIPSSEVTEEMEINADLMLIREHQEAGQQLTFSGEGALSEVHTVYGVMRFNRWTLNNKEKTYPHSPLGDPKSLYERALYWISFPFDVNLSDVFGFGTYGVDWIIEYYDGEGRAEKGYWADSPTFWRYVMDRNNFTLEAGKGYVLALDLDRMKDTNDDFWANNIEQIELFFPSASNVNNIEATDTKTSAHEHACTIDRTGNNGSDINKNRTKADSHWNLIGVPSYANYGSTLTTNGSSTISWLPWPYSATLPYLYEWNAVDNTYTVQSGTTYPFKSMHAYFVQYHGDIYWSLASATPAGVARRAYAEAPETIELKLQIQRDEKMVDQTFVKLSSDEQVRAEFVFDEDLCKEFNSGKTNIYTYVDYLPVAGNTLPMSEQTTIVPVGLQVASEGEYTLVIPEGTSGVGVTLIDKETGIRTNLSGLPYTVTLSKGNYDNRFVLEISPISYVATEIENSEIRDQKSDVRKVLIDGLLYIIHDNKMFDARGARVQ